MRNSTLNSLDKVFDIIKRPPEQESTRVLPEHQQRDFRDLQKAFYQPYYDNEYKDTIQEFREKHQKKKVNWVMKTKLTND